MNDSQPPHIDPTTQSPDVRDNLLAAYIQEHRSSRRWSIFFKLLGFSMVTFVLLNIFKVDFSGSSSILKQAHTAVIDIRGPIDAERPANADSINQALDLAFDNKHVKGVILRINSPGGSPVQARQIYDKIRMLQAKSEHEHKKVYAFIEDLGTSAAYLIASASEEIHADHTSLVGSIGVIMDGFGFTEAMQKFGVERRLYTAGANKALLDAFSPRNPDQEAFIKGELQNVHQSFIQNVRDGRKNRLKETPDIFSGLFWTGEHAWHLGLIDGHKNPEAIAKDLIQAESLVDYTPGMSVLDRLAQRIGASAGSAAVHFLKQVTLR